MTTIQDINPLEYGDTSLVKIEANFANLNADKAENSTVTSHTSNTSNPHSVTKSQVGLSNVPNLNTTTAVAQTHTHSNKALLDTYTQTNADIADAISKEHTHSNKAILDTTTASYTTADESKLDGIETGAEVNDTAGEIKTKYESNADTNAYTDTEKTLLGNQSGVNTGDETATTIKTKLGISTLSGSNTGDQDLSGLALKSNVIEKDSTTVYTPTTQYHPANKKYVDDQIISAGSGDVVGPAGATAGNFAVYDGGTGKVITDGGTPGALATLDTVGTAQIENDAVTFDKIEDIPTNRVLARSTSGTGSIEALTLPNFRTLINVENGADVTDTANVTSAGALMTSNLGVTVQPYDADTTKNDVANTFTQRQTMSALTVDTNTLYVDSVNNRIGIGTTNPTTQAYIYSNSSSVLNDVGLTIEQDGTGDSVINLLRTGVVRWKVGTGSNADFAISNGSLATAEFLIDGATGNVGIGTTSPGSKLDIDGDLNIGSSGTPSRVNIDSQDSVFGGNGTIRMDTQTGTNDRGLKMGVSSGASGYAWLQGVLTGIGNTGNISLNAGGGNVGIGTTSPNYKGHINGSLGIAPGIGTTVTPVSNGDLTISTASNTSVVIRMKGSDGVIRSTTLTLS